MDRKRNQVMVKATNAYPILVKLLLAVWLFPCLVIGFLISNQITKISLSIILSNEVRVNILVPVTLGASAIMITRFFKKPQYQRVTQFLMASTILLLSVIIYLIADKTAQGVTYSPQILTVLTYVVCYLAIIPFVIENRLTSFFKTRKEVDSVFLATSIMWLSPLVAELFIWPMYSYMTLGAMGFSDVLFFYGFEALTSLVIYYSSIMVAGALFGRLEYDGDGHHSRV